MKFIGFLDAESVKLMAVYCMENVKIMGQYGTESVKIWVFMMRKM